MADAALTLKILSDIAVTPIERVKPSYWVFILIAAVILVTLVLIRTLFRKK